MKNFNFKFVVFALLLAFVAVVPFANTEAQAAVCVVHTYAAATCTAPKTCTKCGATLGTALGHHYVVNGNTATCDRCGKTKLVGGTSAPTTIEPTTAPTNTPEPTPVSPVHTHVWAEATCDKPKTCTKCGETEGKALGHDFEKKSEVEATCTEAGEIVYECTRCGKEKKEAKDALGHEYKVSTTAATCTKAGKKVSKCTRCGDVKEESVIEALGHDYKTTTTTATCTKAGETVKKCSRCGDEQKTTTPALGHNYKVTTTTATCTTAGKKVEKCTRCGDTKETTIAALGHKECIVFNSEYHWTECERCDKELGKKEAHKFNDKNVCTVCGYKKSAVDPVDPDTESDGELIVEPWMKENEDLNKLAVSLRSEPYENEDNERANKNIYVLDEKVVYYVDYKNGGKTTDGKVELVLNLPLTATVVQKDGGDVSKKDGTITWTFDGMKKGEEGTKVVVVKYTSLGSAKATFKRVTPSAVITLDGKKKDVSSVINLIIKDFDEEINEEHDPFMYGDKGTETFRPDDTITRAEGALVLTRIFGISTAYDTNEYDFPDLDETYLEARKAIRAARAYGLINGYPDGTFKPNATMTIGEFMTIIARQIEEDEGEGFEIKDENEAIKIYKDKTRLYYISDKEMYDAHWAAQYATLLCRLNMTAVKEKETNLRLGNAITRAEVAQLVNFYLLRAPAKVTRTTLIRFPDVSRNHRLIGDIVEATRETHTYSINEDGKEVAEY